MPSPPTRRTAAPDVAAHWTLDPDVVFLNHGSFGACPRAVLVAQSELRQRMERNPPRFLDRELEPLLDAARAELAAFVGAHAEDIAWVANATTGINTVLRSLDLAPGDEILVTDHAYNACRNAVEHVARRTGARVAVAQIPFPLDAASRVVDALVAASTPRTRIALVDHVTSPTGLVWPIGEIVSALQARAIDVLVDGAHGPGMVPLALDALGAAYYTGNAHKWVCAPKGAAFLHVRRDRQPAIHPLSISHGYQGPTRGRSRFWLEMDWTGTTDPTAVLSVPAALHCIGSLKRGGWPAWMDANRALAIAARDLLRTAWGVEAPCPDDMIGSLVALALPGGLHRLPNGPRPPVDPIASQLWNAFGIEVPVIPWGGRRWIRISAQGYNHLEQYARLADAVRELAQGPVASG